MAKQSQLEMLIDLQDEKVDAALAAVAERQQALNQAKEQLDLLFRYRAEYEQRFREQTKVGIRPVHLHNYQAFISKLHYAIEQQEQVIVSFEKQLEQKQQEWLDEKNQYNAYQKLKERQDLAGQKKENRREQKMSDEYGAKKYADRKKEDAEVNVSNE